MSEEIPPGSAGVLERHFAELGEAGEATQELARMDRELFFRCERLKDALKQCDDLYLRLEEKQQIYRLRSSPPSPIGIETRSDAPLRPEEDLVPVVEQLADRLSEFCALMREQGRAADIDELDPAATRVDVVRHVGPDESGPIYEAAILIVKEALAGRPIRDYIAAAWIAPDWKTRPEQLKRYVLCVVGTIIKILAGQYRKERRYLNAEQTAQLAQRIRAEYGRLRDWTDAEFQRVVFDLEALDQALGRLRIDLPRPARWQDGPHAAIAKLDRIIEVLRLDPASGDCDANLPANASAGAKRANRTDTSSTPAALMTNLDLFAFVRQLERGPDSRELSDRELAFLEANLARPKTPSEMQRFETRSGVVYGTSCADAIAKAQRIAAFNRHLRATSAHAAGTAQDAERRAQVPGNQLTTSTAVLPLDPATIGIAFMVQEKQAGRKPKTTEIAVRMGVTRQALHENLPFESVRKLGHDLFGLFTKRADKGAWTGPRGFKGRDGTLEAEDTRDDQF